jgi:nucleotide-binding universal stress UspA family protein
MRSIVVGTDGSPKAEKAVRWTIDLARDEDVSVCVVSAFPHADSLGEPLAGTARREHVSLVETAENLLARTAREFADAGVRVETEAREGDPAAVIIAVAEERDADLVVAGARGETALQRFMLGGVASKLVHHAPHSVLIVRD